MKNIHITLIVLFAIGAFCLEAQVRKAIIPNIKGYKVLKCDLHLHTVFSDGYVWPNVHIEDALAEGLDAISITDHMEYRRRGSLAKTSLDEAYDVAKKELKGRDLLLIKGVEITRDLPGGNLNALFMQNIDALEPFWNKEKWSSNEGLKDALIEAKRQGAYVFWCHPWWPNDDSKMRWTDVNEDFFKEGLFQGLEIVNGKYHELPYKYALEKGLTIFGNTDAHMPVRVAQGRNRNMTLVFAKNRTQNDIKEALFAGRTAVLSQDRIFGKEEYVLPLVESCLRFSALRVDDNRVEAIIRNNSTIAFTISSTDKLPYAMSQKKVTVPALGTAEVVLTGKDFKRGETYEIPVQIDNVFLSPTQKMNYSIKLKIK